MHLLRDGDKMIKINKRLFFKYTAQKKHKVCFSSSYSMIVNFYTYFRIENISPASQVISKTTFSCSNLHCNKNEIEINSQIF